MAHLFLARALAALPLPSRARRATLRRRRSGRFFTALTALILMAGGAGAHAAPGSGACKLVLVADVPLHYTGNTLQLTFDGEINGKPARMLADTGSFASFLTNNGAERFGLPLHRTHWGIDAEIGKARLWAAKVEQMQVGPATLGETWMDVIDKSLSMPSWDAIIGSPFLMQTDLEISLADKQLKFFRPLDCEDKFLGYWKTGAIVVPYLYNNRRGENPRFTVKVNGVELEAMIDTGVTSSVIGLGAARRAGFRPDGPGVASAEVAKGLGENVRGWTAQFDSLSIGPESISKPSLNVVDMGNVSYDLLLGDDFLRSHHVLFANSQRKLYLSYMGGTPFTQRQHIEPWMRKEAEDGNADAMYMLARMYLGGNGVAKDKDKGDEWLGKAAALGSPGANIELGSTLLHEGHPADAALHLKAALDQLPAERHAALLLYLAREQTGEAAKAKQELEASFARSAGAWPAPVADFYLGRISAEDLLSQAGADPDRKQERTCAAQAYLREWYLAHGDKEKAAALEARPSCGPLG